MIFLNRPKPPFKAPVGIVAKYMQRMPMSVAKWALKEWVKRANTPDPVTGEVDYLSADDWFIEFNRPFMSWTWPFDIDMSEDEVQAHADKTAAYFLQCQQLMIPLDKQLETASQEHKVDIEAVFPYYYNRTEEDRAASIAGVVNRLLDATWWRRHFRKTAGRELEGIIREMGWVNRRKQIYVSDIAVTRRRQQQFRNNTMMDTLMFINELGEGFMLSELRDTSMANPAIRRAELMVRIAGFEQIAKDLGHAGEFITLTAPSRFHCALERSGQRNKKYDGSTPKEIQAYLQQVWSRIRTQLSNEEIKIYGFRVAEPHHDGTPHWHGLFFMEKHHVMRFRQIMAKHGCREDREELGLKYYDTKKAANAAVKVKLERMVRQRQEDGQVVNRALKKELKRAAQAQCQIEAEYWDKATYWTFKGVSARFMSKAIDWNRGSAAGYIAKYIAKNIDGAKANGENAGIDYETDDGKSLMETAERVLAWAGMWGIRQFQQVGGPPVTVWRELRRLKINEYVTMDVIELAGYAADKGDWCKFVQVMGGIDMKRKDRPVQLYKEETDHLNKYGEPVPDLIKGLVDIGTGEVSVSRIHEWVLGFKGSASSPWSSVNNCTKVHKKHSNDELLTRSQILEILKRCEPVPVEAIGFQPVSYEDALIASNIDPIEHEAMIGRVLRGEPQPLTAKQQQDKEYYEYAAKLKALRNKTKASLGTKSGIVRESLVDKQPNAMGFDLFNQCISHLYKNLPNHEVLVLAYGQKHKEKLCDLVKAAKHTVDKVHKRLAPSSDKALFAAKAKGALTELQQIDYGLNESYSAHALKVKKGGHAPMTTEQFRKVANAVLNNNHCNIGQEYKTYTVNVVNQVRDADRVAKYAPVGQPKQRYKYALPTEAELMAEANTMIQNAKEAFWDEYEIAENYGY